VERVDQVVLDQRLDEPRAAVDEDVPRVALLELADLLDHVAVDDRRVAPGGIRQREGDDVRRHRVEVVGELALEARPRRRELLVGNAAQQLAPAVIVSSTLNWSPSGPREKPSAQPTRSNGSAPLGASTTPSTEIYSVTTSLPMGSPLARLAAGR